MRQTPEGSLAHVEDQGQSGLPSFSLLSSALVRLSAPSLSLLSSLDHQNLVDIFTSSIFFSPTELLIPPGPATHPSLPVCWGRGAVPLSASRSCHHLVTESLSVPYVLWSRFTAVQGSSKKACKERDVPVVWGTASPLQTGCWMWRRGRAWE